MAAVLAGGVEAESTERAVAGDGTGRGIWVSMNMWYVCTDARKKSDASGMVGRPTRRTRFWSANAWNKSIFCNPLLGFSEGHGVGHVGVIVFG